MTGDDGLERYRVISRLGTGGMATVLLAEDQRLARKVALKRLAGGDDSLQHREGSESNRTLMSRLRREALLGASVSHPNLVSIYDIVSTEDDGLVIVMEYVPGETLRDRMLREGRLSADVALPILQGIASGLDAIHRRGIVHRDLKPANVLLGDDETVKLADFGIATRAESTRITSQGAVVGTFRYMAPEQLEDAPSSPAMDIYALAVVALEMLSGQRARPESHPIALAHALATQPPPDLRNAWPDAPAPVAELLMRGMARDPALRPRRAGELVGRLRAALVDETTRHPVGSRPANRARAGQPAGPARAPNGPKPLRPTGAAAAADALVERETAPAPDRAPQQPAAPAPIAPTSPEPVTGSMRRRGARKSPPAAAEVKPRDGRSERRAASAGADRRRLVAPIALVAVLAAVAAAVIATNGPSGPSHASRGSSAATNTHRARKHPRSTNKTSASARKTAPSTRTTSSSTGTSRAAASGSGISAAAASGTASTPAAPADSTSDVASAPVQAVESFYHLAADHQYAKAWSLADSNFQQQLDGYQSFEAGQADDRAITFNKATVTNQTASSATVAVQTTSRRSNGTQSCTGNVNLVKNGATWQLDQIGIDCH